MITRELLNPASIVVVGGSNNLRKPGGRILQNIMNGGYSGNLYVVNLKEEMVQGIPACHSAGDLPQVELAILAIAAGNCPDVIRILTEQKNTKAFIILSAGFS